MKVHTIIENEYDSVYMSKRALISSRDITKRQRVDINGLKQISFLFS